MLLDSPGAYRGCGQLSSIYGRLLDLVKERRHGREAHVNTRFLSWYAKMQGPRISFTATSSESVGTKAASSCWRMQENSWAIVSSQGRARHLFSEFERQTVRDATGARQGRFDARATKWGRRCISQGRDCCQGFGSSQPGWMLGHPSREGGGNGETMARRSSRRQSDNAWKASPLVRTDALKRSFETI